jgi:hypothetical protein
MKKYIASPMSISRSSSLPLILLHKNMKRAHPMEAPLMA